MGLCKCPKKKVTNLFCFEHRVNVCEHCLVANHSKCVVQSYLQWLQDSDYDPTCRLCGKTLADDTCGTCVRLQCYDVFHWSCIDDYARRMPPNTAPAGYTCPSCHMALFPASNTVSPVVDVLKELLSTVNWARAGLGLPLISEPDIPQKLASNNAALNVGFSGPPAVHQLASRGSVPAMDGGQYRVSAPPTQSVISMDETVPYSRGVDKSELINSLQKMVGGVSEESSLRNSSHDHDHDKYKRRPALQWLSRWFSSRSGSGPRVRDPNAGIKRFFILAIIGLIGFITIVIIFTRLGRSVTDSDPFLDPMANPNIRVQQDSNIE